MSDRFPVIMPPRRSLTQTVCETVRELILDRHLAPAERVSIDELARELEVSATPVREALAALESEGLVVREAHRGYTVAPTLDSTSFDQLYEVRLLLEPSAAGLAAVNATPAQIAVLEEANDGMHEAVLEMSRDPKRHSQLTNYAFYDRSFHETLASASGNPLLRDVIVRMRPHPRIYRFYFTAGVAEEAVPEHDRIFRAVNERNPEEARRAMVSHLEKARDRYRPWAISEQKGAQPGTTGPAGPPA